LGVGAECSTGAACASGLCVSSRADAGVSGYCTAFCDRHRQLCPDNAICLDSGDGDSVGLCARPCNAITPCPAGFNCAVVSDDGTSACLP
ncbi:MAG TPA: hypothetical protein VNN80_10720, partial [Polyangiaceae bacterium]|nr:hypothetical protein [Polyangiaceae bacterium]